MSANGYTTAEQLLSLAGKRSFKDVLIPNPHEPGSVLKFRIRTLTEAEWSEIDVANVDATRGGLSITGIRSSDARLIAASLVDGEGNLLLIGKDAAKRVSELGSSITQPLARECRAFSNLRSLEDSEKNLADAGGSGTSSPE